MAALRLTFFALVVFSTLLAPGADAHGFLQQPQSRNYIAYRNYGFGCPHCGQGKGGTPSYCGDPFQDVDTTRAWTPFTARNTYPTPTSNVLVQGSTIDITLQIWTNHGGRMQVRVCPLAKTAVTQACFDRAEHQLRRVTSSSATNNKIYWYLRPGDQTITQRFRLPSGVSCTNGCMLQWYWIGYQSCRFPCLPLDVDVPGDCGKNLLNDQPYFPTCTSLSQTERYYNCADVIIRPSGGTTTPPPTTCNADCQTCTTEAAKNRAGTSGLVPTCSSCASSNSAEKAQCFRCMTRNPLTDITSRCLSCVATRRAGAGEAVQCSDYCATYARSAFNMDKCTYCLSRSFIQPLDCRTCMTIGAGDITRMNTCLDCLASNFGPAACHGCARRTTATARATCFSCLQTRRTAGQSLTSCYA